MQPTSPTADPVDRVDEPTSAHEPVTGERRWLVAGAVASFGVAALLFTRFNIYGWLTRDETIYIYGGQQMTRGVAPYASIMDPKGPIATIFCGLGVGVARLLGRSDVLVVRAEFLLLSVLTAVALYLLVVQLFKSVTAGVVAAVVFSSFEGYAHNAMQGPDAKTPGVLFLTLAMWFGVRRQWFWAACTASLAFFVWQPLFPFPIVMIIAAAVYSVGSRWRSLGIAVAGAATPAVVLLIYFAAEGALRDFINGTFLFPLTGVTRPPETLGHRIRVIFRVVRVSYHFSGRLFWAGVILLLLTALIRVVAARAAWRTALLDPYVLIVLVTFVAEAAYACYDFQGFPDLFPLLPYPAIGFGAAVAMVLERLRQPQARYAVTAAVLACAAALTVASVGWFTPGGDALRSEEASACAVQKTLVPGTPLYVMGDPIPLVLLHRRNPDQYAYLGSGLDQWKIDHTKGGFAGWTRQIVDSRASVILVDVWQSPMRLTMQRWLSSHGYHHGYIGPWQVYLTSQARAGMPAKGLRLAHKPGFWPHTVAHTRFTKTGCSGH